MNEDVREMLDEQIRNEFDALTQYGIGSKEHSIAADNLSTLYKLRIEEVKNDFEADLKYRTFEHDCQVKQKQESDEQKNRYIRFGLDAASIVLPLIFYGIWMGKGFKFEESGTFTSTKFRNLFSHFRPTKK